MIFSPEKIPIFLYACATYSEIPSNISTMSHLHGYERPSKLEKNGKKTTKKNVKDVKTSKKWVQRSKSRYTFVNFYSKFSDMFLFCTKKANKH